jgi:hypothetical protein
MTEAEKLKAAQYNAAIKAEINQNKVNIDRTIFQKTPEDKTLLKRMKASCKK